MKNQIALKKMMVALALTGMAAGTAQAGTVAANASANVLAPLAISAGATDLAFGDVSADASAPSTVTIDTAGAATTSGAWAADNGTAGDFNVTGGAGANYSITLPAADVTLTSPASDTVIVNNFVSNPAATGTLDLSGKGAFKVGATLTLGADQPAGLYTGTYDVTVAYQ